MTEYKSNSHAAREAQKNDNAQTKRMEPVAAGEMESGKKGVLSRIVMGFLTSNAGNLKNYIFRDVIVPGILDTLHDATINSVDMMFGRGSGRRRSGGYAEPRVSYWNSYKRSRDDRDYRDEDDYAARTPVSYGYDNIKFRNRGDAESVLMSLNERIDEDSYATIANYYELVGMENRIRFSDEKYGWTECIDTVPRRVGDRYMLFLPKARALR